jgi:HPt (histidine-containing phosphotransfer) domain-containing protein
VENGVSKGDASMIDSFSQNAPDSNAPAPNSGRVFDLDVTLVRLGGSTELFEKLVYFYFEDSERLLQQLRHAAVHGDIAQVERAAHTLKSLAANFEALPAARAALRVEESAQNGKLGSAVEQLPELEVQLRRLTEALIDYAPGSTS